MSAPVDVLAVLDHRAGQMATAAMRKVRSVTPEQAAKIAADLREARAAVAELMETTEAMVESGDEGADTGSIAGLRWSASKVRVLSALTRCKGAQA
jgi:hypothetical protein